MRPHETLRLATVFSLALLAACDPTDQNEPAGPKAGRQDASTLDAAQTDAAPIDAGQLDAARADRDAADGQARDADRDAADGTVSPQLAQLATSRVKWSELRAASPGPYWYLEENCMANSATGSFAIIQVESNTPRERETVVIPKASCEASVDRYGNRVRLTEPPETVEQLYDVCDAQLRRYPGSNFSLDARGVIKGCWYRQLTNCVDSCGSGFYLRDLQFGLAPATFDAGTPRAGGVLTDAGR